MKKNVSKILQDGRRYLFLSILLIVIQVTILLLCTGDIYYHRYNLFVAIHVVYTIGALLFLCAKTPGLVNERGKPKPDIKTWDKYLLTTHNVLMLFVFPIIAGLDYRFNEPLAGEYWIFFGYVLFVLANLFVLSSMLVNKHFETNVRIQKDRNHRTITRWPYSFVRHPGYLGTMLWAISVPMILGSKLAFITSLASVLLILTRTHLEDKTLKEELDGYKDYANSIKYRLLPYLY